MFDSDWSDGLVVRPVSCKARRMSHEVVQLIFVQDVLARNSPNRKWLAYGPELYSKIFRSFQVSNIFL
jgi:hypothetical protein